MDPKSARRMERFSQFAVAAAKEAMQDSGLDMTKEDPFRAGCAIGSGVGSLALAERETRRLDAKGPGGVNPLFIPMMISNMAAGNVAIHLGLKGKNIDIVTACASGTHNIGEAFRSIQYGDADIMFAGGAEACISPLGVAGFTQLTALNTTDDPARASIPFDAERGGFVIAAGDDTVPFILGYATSGTARTDAMPSRFRSSTSPNGATPPDCCCPTVP